MEEGGLVAGANQNPQEFHSELRIGGDFIIYYYYYYGEGPVGKGTLKINFFALSFALSFLLGIIMIIRFAA